MLKTLHKISIYECKTLQVSTLCFLQTNSALLIQTDGHFHQLPHNQYQTLDTFPQIFSRVKHITKLWLIELNLTESACRDVMWGHLKNISADILALPAADQGLMKLSDMYSSQETNYCRTHYSFIFIVSVSETASSFTPWHRFCRPVYPDWD